jgi:molybdopterin-containing oxidoreductase family membrane subunit
MATAMKTKFEFVIDLVSYAFKGSKRYYLWLGFLLLWTLPWMVGGYLQLTKGMSVTGLTDQVSWGIYIANFVFLVGVAAGAVTIVFPAYVYNVESLKKVVVLGEILAITAVTLCIFFIMFHMGRIDRLWHMIPVIGIYNFPYSLLTWDTLALTGYFLLNLFSALYYLYQKYTGEPVNARFYFVWMLISIFWALSIHTVTAFLLSTMPARPMWHSSVLPIRFIATAFAAGPALMIILFLIIRKKTKLWIEDKAINLLSTIVVACLSLALFITLSEIVTELYHPTEHSAGLRYLMFGHNGLTKLVPWYWTSLLLMVAAWLVLMVPSLRKNEQLLPWLCAMVFVGIWIEKGLGLIIPASIPTPIGEYTEYYPSLVEIFNCVGNWAIGGLMLTLMLKAAIGVLVGDVQRREALLNDSAEGDIV